VSEPVSPLPPEDEDYPSNARIVDPRAVRVSLAPGSTHAEIEAVVIEPPEIPLFSAPPVAGTGVLGGITTGHVDLADVSGDGRLTIVDGRPLEAGLERLDDTHVRLIQPDGEPGTRTAILLLPPEDGRAAAAGLVRREVVVDGWRVEVELESERRASLRERARRGREVTAHGGPTHVRAIIPGRIVSVSIAPGDPVEAGQQLLVVEAMKMQNELRAPRDGIVSSVAVGIGGTIEVGDLLLVLE
jgi:biotin carboxyl carrier protein